MTKKGYRDELEAARRKIDKLERENEELRRERDGDKTPARSPDADSRSRVVFLAAIAVLAGGVAVGSFVAIAGTDDDADGEAATASAPADSMPLTAIVDSAPRVPDPAQEELSDILSDLDRARDADTWRDADWALRQAVMAAYGKCTRDIDTHGKRRILLRVELDEHAAVSKVSTPDGANAALTGCVEQRLRSAKLPDGLADQAATIAVDLADTE